MKETLKRQRLFFISIIGIVVVSLIMGTTFAYQTIKINETETRKVVLEAGVLDVSFETTNLINNTNMPLLSAYIDADYTEFTVDNTKSTGDAIFKISLADIEYGYFEYEYVDESKTEIKSKTENNGCRAETPEIQAACIIDENFKYTLVEVKDEKEILVKEGNFADLSSTEVSVSDYDTIVKGKTKTFRLYLWFKETENNQNHLENTYFKAKINVTSRLSDEGTKVLADTLIESAQIAATNGDKIRSIFVEPSNLSTIPGVEPSAEDEKIMSYTADDYTATTGKYSYYYRGTVEDNYIEFNNMCWRIVRIEGDGSIKIILSAQKKCSEITEEDTSSAFIGTGNYGYDSTHTNINGDIINVAKYLNPVTKADQSMVKAFYDFQQEIDSSLINKIKVDNWCLGDLETGYIYNSSSKTYTTGIASDLRYNGTTFRYSSGVADNSLICNGTSVNKFNSVVYEGEEIVSVDDMLVGTLTVNELYFSGMTGHYTKPYIIENAQESQGSNVSYFTSLSLSQFNQFYAYGDLVFYIEADATYSDSGAIYDLSGFHDWYDNSLPEGDFRPAITLKEGTVVALFGDGTINTPYIVK